MTAPHDSGDLSHWKGEPVSVWARLWNVPRVEAWSSVSSTNERARRIARGAPPWTVVVAEHQSAGRGRSGRLWQSTAGAGLWASFILPPRPSPAGELVPLLAGLAVAQAIEIDPAGGGLDVGLKWPNDVWIAGRKIAGILCEGTGDAMIVGVGVNCRLPAGGFSPAHAATAGSLEAVTGRTWFESRLMSNLVRELRRLSEPHRLRWEGAAARAWAERDVLRGHRVRVGSVEGRAAGMTPDGALLVEREDGSRTAVRAGHVEWLAHDE